MVVITEYYWGGKKFGFKIKSHCRECALIGSMIEGMLKKEFKGKDVRFVQKLWLTHLWEALSKWIYHPPGLTVDGKKIFQYSNVSPLPKREYIKNIVINKLRKIN